jgi:hypothetical protein
MSALPPGADIRINGGDARATHCRGLDVAELSEGHNYDSKGKDYEALRKPDEYHCSQIGAGTDSEIPSAQNSLQTK